MTAFADVIFSGASWPCCECALWQRVSDTHHDSEAALQIDILEVEGKYYGFSGCHRYEVQHHVHMPNHQTVSSARAQ